MSGHSHFRTIKAQKEMADAKRGQLFSKLARLITIAVKEKGSNPAINAKLKNAIDQAKQFNMPKENIERAIKKGTGELAGENLEEFSFEGFGPGGIALIIEGITDNKNRALGEIKNILSRYEGKMAGEGAVKWMFERKGLVIIDTGAQTKSKEELELAAIEIGVDDVRQEDGFLYIYTKPDDLEKAKKSLEEKGLKIESASLSWAAKEEIETSDKERAQKLFELLDENDAVQGIYSNLKT